MSDIGLKRKNSCKTLSSEEKEFTWEIPNFRQMITTATNTDLHNGGYTFKAGSSIGLPSSWKLFLTKNQFDLGIYVELELQKAPEGVQKIKAAFGFKTVTNEKKKFAFNDFQVKGFGWRKALFALDNFPEENLENGSLVINIDFTIVKDIIVNGEYKRCKFEHASVNATVDDFQKLLDSGDNADVTFVMADGRTLKAHGNIMKARSRVFSAMLEKPMQEAATIGTGTIRVEDVSYEVMKRILTFIYSGKLDDKWEEVVDEIVYAANKYELLLLLKFFDETLSITCKPETALDLMDFAKMYGLKTAEYEIGEYVKAHIGEIVQARIASEEV